MPRIAIISFPGTNGDTENLRAFWRCGFQAFVFRWNDSREKLAGVDGYFIGAGFSYEDRGRSGMVAARDPLFPFLHGEAERGKVILGNCNGAQVLVESGLIPLGSGLRMSLARNAIKKGGEWQSPGFLNEWIFITRTCKRERCATSDWDGVMQIPMAHGEGRYVTKDPDLIGLLEESDQIAFRYCDASGKVSDDPFVTLNGSTGAIAGICNPAGNVVALMPHPERTLRLGSRSGPALGSEARARGEGPSPLDSARGDPELVKGSGPRTAGQADGDPYFLSVKKWIGKYKSVMPSSPERAPKGRVEGRIEASLPERRFKSVEIFIDTLIVNNEERTVEQAAHRIAPSLRLKQFRYLVPTERKPEEVLTTIAIFNPNKETAYVRRDGCWFRWKPERKALEEAKNPLTQLTLLRRDEPDTGAAGWGQGSESGVCYACAGIAEQDLCSENLQEIFANPHASTLEIIHAL